MTPPTTGEQPSLAQATIYLAEEGVQDLSDVVKSDDSEMFELGRENGLDGRLYVQRQEPLEPEWVGVLEGLTGASLAHVRTQLAGAVLVVRLAGRIFAFTFGQGRHLLVAERFVDDFGLRVAANTVDPMAIRSLDGRTFGRGVLLTRRQSSRPGRVEALGLQVDREMLRSITGRSRATGAGRVHGGTSLGLTREIDLATLDDFGRELLTSYSATSYQEAFAQLDQMRALPANDPLVARLDSALVAALRTPDLMGAYLAPPAMLDWEIVSGFRFSDDPRGTVRDDLELTDYLVGRGPTAAPPTLEQLRADEARTIARDSSRATSRWTIYRCLVWEAQLDEGAYVLADGRWWRVDRAYLDSINATVARVPTATVNLPTPSIPNLVEKLYNAEAAAATGGILLDIRRAHVRTERGGFELCDVFVPPNKFVHVKRGLGSQELSYLFTQGVTSAEGYRNAREVRERLRALINATAAHVARQLPVDERPTPLSFEVVYAVVSGSPARVPRTLPFFARAALARAVRTLEDLDFKFSAIGVPVR